MFKPRCTQILFILLAATGFWITGCRKETNSWEPEGVLVLKPDSGLTTQTFDFRVDILNLPISHTEFYIRWDLNGDSVWDAPFTAFTSAQHRFYQKGIHLVKAEVLTEDGQRIVLQKNIRISQGYSAPHASFTVDPPTGNYLNQFTFDASTTFDDEDPFSELLFRWDFEDDGGWDTEPSSNPVARFRYKRSGTYTPRLSVTDPTRRTATIVNTLIVNLHDDLIHPDFTWLPNEGTVKDTFLLDASATRHESDSLRVFSYTWDIQKEIVYGPFTEPQLSHVFWVYGMQKITLTATDQHGLSNSISKEFFVIKENKPPNPKIFVSTPYGNTSSNFFISAWPSLDDVTPPSKMLIRWDFEGDGNWDTGWSYDKTLYHQFPEPGDFWVTLQAEDEGGERATTKTLVRVSGSSNATGFIIDRRDGKYYGTVKIGDQWWMSDNLDYRTNPKMDIPMLQKCYGETDGKCDLYGSLYQGERVVAYNNSGQNICPEGWRLPTKTDWMKLGEQVPVTEGRDAMLVGGSLGFNGRYTGSGYFVFEYSPIYRDSIIDTVYTFSGLYEEVKYLSITTRPFFEENMAQFYMGLQKNFGEMDLRWGNLNGYFYARCIKME